MRMDPPEGEEWPPADALWSYDEARAVSRIGFSLAVPSRWTLETLASALKAVRGVRSRLADLEADLERRLAQMMPKRQLDLEGVGRVVRHKGGPRKHPDREGLTRTVVARALDERAIDFDGQPLESEAACVARVLGVCFRFEPRWGELKARGIDPDEYAETIEGTTHVQVTD